MPSSSRRCLPGGETPVGKSFQQYQYMDVEPSFRSFSTSLLQSMHSPSFHTKGPYIHEWQENGRIERMQLRYSSTQHNAPPTHSRYTYTRPSTETHRLRCERPAFLRAAGTPWRFMVLLTFGRPTRPLDSRQDSRRELRGPCVDIRAVVLEDAPFASVSILSGRGDYGVERGERGRGEMARDERMM